MIQRFLASKLHNIQQFVRSEPKGTAQHCSATQR
jgi:hypothetical protein